MRITDLDLRKAQEDKAEVIRLKGYIELCKQKKIDRESVYKLHFGHFWKEEFEKDSLKYCFEQSGSKPLKGEKLYKFFFGSDWEDFYDMQALKGVLHK